MDAPVQIEFDCLPLRSVNRLDIPLDASPVFRAKCERIQRAIERLGKHNTYYLHNAVCRFHLTNSPQSGLLEFSWEGTVTTDETDQRTTNAYIEIELARETCDWLTEPVLSWFKETVRHAVLVEFDRFIAAGDLEQTKQRLKRLEEEMDAQGGYMGMYL